MVDEPYDDMHRAVVQWDPFRTDLKLAEDEILGKLGPTCTCPDWWFPRDIRDVARRLPHNYARVLYHHVECAKTRAERGEISVDIPIRRNKR